MIDALSSIAIGEQRRAPAKDSTLDSDAQPPFSFALAAAALEHRAGASLKAFGGAPAASAPTSIGEGDAASRGDDGAAGSLRSNAARATEESGQRSASSIETATAKPSPAAPSAALPREIGETVASQPPVSAFAGSSVGIAKSAAIVAQTRVADTAAAREISALRNAFDTNRPTRAAATHSSQPAQQEFARLLARRLENGATSFEIRLDPPELGRVEARLTIGEAGKAALALKFENQAAFDMFARDETALRAAIADAGFDLGAGDLAFSMAQSERESGAPPSPPITAVTPTPLSAEPSSIAPFSRGVVDIRV